MKQTNDNMKKTKAISAKEKTKIVPLAAAAPAPPAPIISGIISGKPTDAKTDGLSGPVKQVMHTTYKAHQKPGTIIQGKIESDYTHARNNLITTYNEKGAKILTDFFKSTLHDFLVPDLASLGKKIIDCALREPQGYLGWAARRGTDGRRPRLGRAGCAEDHSGRSDRSW